MKNLIFLRKIPLQVLMVLMFCISVSMHAQSIKRQSISCMGSTMIAGGSVIEQTAGQPYHTQAFSDYQTSVLQGFQQPSVFKVDNITPPEYLKNLRLDVYPNPAAYSVTIRSEETIKNTIIRVTDMDGRLMDARRVAEMQTYTLNCEDWVNGTYIITVTDENRNMTSLKILINK